MIRMTITMILVITMPMITIMIMITVMRTKHTRTKHTRTQRLDPDSPYVNAATSSADLFRAIFEKVNKKRPLALLGVGVKKYLIFLNDKAEETRNIDDGRTNAQDSCS